ncbi:MAG: hypothetical protein A3B86_02360 [Candidatus Yanofskybacteria bacterium RIFCSPHIGHO2_02_FULL_38_22b]|uniref:Transcriptional repressor PaaX-like central Cas2-like domain-containing protein n=1 Tax=Candidatus Yanofskybacteria bacterium RIFCSPHIGHO2_02_FULL_38_22b TaxID=1802673 RepID=A0A1F8F3E5_9BACT|nr:MAG: hypothetical protein A3B86_02360 [Candidatus Yanofskybacteria bacterium RIFCSPHIGHO2_02_FULL_38_22b]OGN20289.1 MAG: hypothetical protein A2910_03195 [Candidatus Yanofskybacteria bacterium RIFCSPLOWO2_01_FULL_39_28]
MKGDFVLKLIKSIGGFGIDVYDTWQWQPIYYKGWHVSGPEYKRFRKGLTNLEGRGFLSNLRGDSYKFTQQGIGWFKYSRIKYFALKNKNKRWDNKWRVIIFDIPNSLNKERNWLRSRLKNLDFQILQKSVFTIPYKCEEELGDLCKQLGLFDYVDVIVANSIGSREEELKRYYNL